MFDAPESKLIENYAKKKYHNLQIAPEEEKAFDSLPVTIENRKALQTEFAKHSELVSLSGRGRCCRGCDWTGPYRPRDLDNP